MTQEKIIGLENNLPTLITGEVTIIHKKFEAEPSIILTAAAAADNKGWEI